MTTVFFCPQRARRDDGTVRNPGEFVTSTIISTISTIILMTALIVLFLYMV
ncbi:hypothetical protein [Mycolicibacterium baixiangningiae]|uniref:hypothetical protein n=1 Tax=Mycolicibacterium baixiangningiae TaxID=2761578 RepID=UPI0018D09672|nr:hypothetical protein [Mycolicibacterium baixiangningiae]